MYSRGFGAPRQSDFDEQDYPRQPDYDEAEDTRSQPPAVECGGRHPRRSGGGLGLSRLFSGINTEDLLLIAIAVLLLLDGDPDNDILIIALALLLFF